MTGFAGKSEFRHPHDTVVFRADRKDGVQALRNGVAGIFTDDAGRITCVTETDRAFEAYRGVKGAIIRVISQAAAR
jgi:hypothetical protein